MQKGSVESYELVSLPPVTGLGSKGPKQGHLIPDCLATPGNCHPRSSWTHGVTEGEGFPGTACGITTCTGHMLLLSQLGGSADGHLVLFQPWKKGSSCEALQLLEESLPCSFAVSVRRPQPKEVRETIPSRARIPLLSSSLDCGGKWM